LLALAFAVAWGVAIDIPTTPLGPVEAAEPVSWSLIAGAAGDLAAPQLALTIGNAVLLTALVARDCFGDRAAHVTPRRLAISSGLANLALAPFGALPMCHGAGGLVAHHRFGARGATAPALLGVALLALAAAPGDMATAALQAVPSAGLGALLMVAAVDLMASRRLRASRPNCWPVIGVAAAVTLLADPLWGLLAGTGAEAARRAVAARLAAGLIR
jgi:MFS superfamily sulfate permease-like transporter